MGQKSDLILYVFFLKRSGQLKVPKMWTWSLNSNRLITGGVVFIVYTAMTLAVDTTTAPDPCDTHGVLDGSERLSRVQKYSNPDCDNHLDPGWYMLRVGNSSAEIPSKCIKNYACGTTLPLRIDLEGQLMPGVGETIQASICSSYDILGKWDCCVLRKNTQIRNCGQFYVYYLYAADRCPVAYCAQEIGGDVDENLTAKTGEAVDYSGQTTPILDRIEISSSNNLEDETRGVTISDQGDSTTEEDDSPVLPEVLGVCDDGKGTYEGLCDNITECGDGSDEANCGIVRTSESGTPAHVRTTPLELNDSQTSDDVVTSSTVGDLLSSSQSVLITTIFKQSQDSTTSDLPLPATKRNVTGVLSVSTANAIFEDTASTLSSTHDESTPSFTTNTVTDFTTTPDTASIISSMGSVSTSIAFDATSDPLTLYNESTSSLITAIASEPTSTPIKYVGTDATTWLATSEPMSSSSTAVAIEDMLSEITTIATDTTHAQVTTVATEATSLTLGTTEATETTDPSFILASQESETDTPSTSMPESTTPQTEIKTQVLQHLTTTQSSHLHTPLVSFPPTSTQGKTALFTEPFTTTIRSTVSSVATTSTSTTTSPTSPPVPSPSTSAPTFPTTSPSTSTRRSENQAHSSATLWTSSIVTVGTTVATTSVTHTTSPEAIPTTAVLPFTPSTLSTSRRYTELTPRRDSNSHVVLVFRIGMHSQVPSHFRSRIQAVLARILRRRYKGRGMRRRPREVHEDIGEKYNITADSILIKSEPEMENGTLEVAFAVVFYHNATDFFIPADELLKLLEDPEVKKELEHELGLELEEVYKLDGDKNVILTPPSKSSGMEPTSLFFLHFGLFVSIIVICGICLAVIATALTYVRCRGRCRSWDCECDDVIETEKPRQRGFLRPVENPIPDVEIMKDEHMTGSEEALFAVNGKNHLSNNDPEEGNGWIVPIGDLSREEKEPPATEDTKL